MVTKTSAPHEQNHGWWVFIYWMSHNKAGAFLSLPGYYPSYHPFLDGIFPDFFLPSSVFGVPPHDELETPKCWISSFSIIIMNIVSNEFIPYNPQYNPINNPYISWWIIRIPFNSIFITMNQQKITTTNHHESPFNSYFPWLSSLLPKLQDAAYWDALNKAMRENFEEPVTVRSGAGP